MKSYPDCYFITYVDSDASLRIASLCLECRAKEPDKKAMFWAGSEKGYKADSRFTCNHCGLILHEPEIKE